MIFEQIRTGGDRNFGYVIGDEKERKAALVDPSYDPERCIRKAREHGLEIVYIVNTHGHSDHTNGNTEAREMTGAKVVAFGRHADIRVGDGDSLALGSLRLNFMHTPGHTPDCVCVLVDGKIITGDVLFVGKVGGTATLEQAQVEYESLKRLMELPDETEVYPGHDVGVQPSSTIGDERMSNPFLTQADFESFYALKQHWSEYKRMHGIA